MTAAHEGPDPTPTEAAQPPPHPTARRTRTSAAWTSIAIAIVLGIFLLVFILQNTDSVKIHFLSLDGSFPLALGLLLAAIAGALAVFLVGSARILQLRRSAKRHLRAESHH